jgi:hypothetical protein
MFSVAAMVIPSGDMAADRLDLGIIVLLTSPWYPSASGWVIPVNSIWIRLALNH